jgi:hypothetical protein
MLSEQDRNCGRFTEQELGERAEGVLAHHFPLGSWGQQTQQWWPWGSHNEPAMTRFPQVAR